MIRKRKKTLKSLGIKVFATNGLEKVDPEEVVQILGENLVSSVLIEGGGSINAAFLEKKCIDKVILYFAPKLIGGKDAPTFLEGAGMEKMADAVDLIDTSIIKIGKDFKFIGYPSYSKEGIL